MRQGLLVMLLCHAVWPTAAKQEPKSMSRLQSETDKRRKVQVQGQSHYYDSDYSASLELEDMRGSKPKRMQPARSEAGAGSWTPAEAKVTNEAEIVIEQGKVWGLVLSQPNDYDDMAAEGGSNIDYNNISRNSNNSLDPSTVSILERHNFGSYQNATDQQLLRLQNYNLLYNAERQTYFQLHTNLMMMDEQQPQQHRVLQHIVSNALSATFGINVMDKSGTDGTSTSVHVETVQLYDAASLRQSRYNPFNPTRIIIHGWLGNAHANIYSALLPAYLSLGDGNYNIFTVDWGRGAIADYITASYRVKPVGQTLAKFIDFLHQEAGMRFEDLQLIGFSMGAHVAGIAGKHVQTGRVRIIRALDPALPFFHYAQERERIANGDADYVEVLHTSVGSYGFDRPLGHVDFYANWGSQQPGCFWHECSHWRAFALFAASLEQSCGGLCFMAEGCQVEQWQSLTRHRQCTNKTGRRLSMGGDLGDVSLEMLAQRRGIYYFQTNANAPYGMDLMGGT